MTLPIFESGRLQGAYRGARAEYDEAVATYDQTLMHALKEVADSAVSARALDARLAKSREALDAAHRGPTTWPGSATAAASGPISTCSLPRTP